jgi:lactate dehydrogenase-like 2-hydroxyacid dehydrogenase
VAPGCTLPAGENQKKRSRTPITVGFGGSFAKRLARSGTPLGETGHLFNDALLSKMKRGSSIVNTARRKICDPEATVRALESGRLAGYEGDVWFPHPPPKEHSWRTMPNDGVTPHVSGTTLFAQARYAAGTREILKS